jgi:hypothetical protein
VTVALICLTAILVLDALYRLRRRRGAPAHASANRNYPGASALFPRLWRVLVAARVAFELGCWALVLGYVVLLIWTFAVGPIKPIHEWFTH